MKSRMREICTYGSVRGTEDTANSRYDILEQYKVEKRGGCRGSVYSTEKKMKQLGELIVSQTLSGQTIEKHRTAARGIMRRGDEVYMIHCAYFYDYTFPGGGVEEGENPIIALTRECMEEAGAIINNIRPYCKIVEKREVDEESYLIHESLFYLCDIEVLNKS